MENSRHRIYKQGTSRIEDFLLETSTKLPNGSQWSSTLQSVANKSVYRLSTKEFVRLAKDISQSNIRVPKRVITDLQSVIDQRNQHSKLFENKWTVEEANRKHKHFIWVLGRVYRLLSPVLRPGSAGGSAPRTSITLADLVKPSKRTPERSKAPKAPPCADPEVGENSTTDEEPSDDDCLDDTEAVMDDEAEFDFALRCLLQEINDLRKQVRKEWQAYKDRQISLLTATIMTNTAFDLLQRSIRQFAEDTSFLLPNVCHASFTSSAVLPALLVHFRELCKKRGLDDMLEDEVKASESPSLYDVADELCFYGVLTLMNHKSAVDQDSNEYYKFLATGKVPKRSTNLRNEKTVTPEFVRIESEEKAENNHLRKLRIGLDLLRGYTHTALVLSPSSPYPYRFLRDELTLNLQYRLLHNSDPSWTALGLQILIDIHIVLGEDVERPLADARRIGQEVSESIQVYRAMKDTSALPKQFSAGDDLFQHVQERIKHQIDEDLVAKAAAALKEAKANPPALTKGQKKRLKQKAKKEKEKEGSDEKDDKPAKPTLTSAMVSMNFDSSPFVSDSSSEAQPTPKQVSLIDAFQTKPYFMLRNNPVLTGSAVFAIVTLMHRQSIVTPYKASPLLVCCIYLYYAMHLAGYIKVSWPDAEFLVATHGMQKIFLGDHIPNDIDAFARRLRMCMGVPVAFYAKHYSKSPDTMTMRTKEASDTRGLQLSEFLDIYEPFFEDEDAANGWDVTAQNVRAFLVKQVMKKEEVKKVVEEMEEKLELGKMAKGKGKQKARPDRNHPTLAYEPTPAELLEALSGILRKEELNLHFNYLSMTTRCVRFIYDVCDILETIRVPLQGPVDYLGAVCYLLDYIKMAKKDEEWQGVYWRVAAAMGHMIDNEGREELDLAERISGVKFKV